MLCTLNVLVLLHGRSVNLKIAAVSLQGLWFMCQIKAQTMPGIVLAPPVMEDTIV